MTTNQEDGSAKQEEGTVDFSNIKHKVKHLFSSKGNHERSGEGNSEKEHASRKHSGSFFARHGRWIVPLFILLLTISMSVYLRTMPQRMPIADDWATSSVENYYKSQLVGSITSQYPNLPQQNINSLVEKEWQKVLSTNGAVIEQQKQATAAQFRAQFQDESGTLYLLGIDPWHYYRQTYYLISQGHPGNSIKDGQYWDTYRLAPLGVQNTSDFHPFIAYLLYKLMNLVGEYSLMFTFFFVGTIFCALAVIPAFFIGKRVTGNNIGGFFTSLLLAVSSFFVARTTGESSDTDVWVIFFPLMIVWFFLEAFYATSLKKKLAWITGAGLMTGLFAFAWSGWWYVFDFILGTLGIYLIYVLATQYKTWKETVKSTEFLDNVYLLITYFVSTSIVTTILVDITASFKGMFGPLEFLHLKDVAVNSLWPNIMTTVAELNVPPFTQVVAQLGGSLIFWLAIVGICLTLLKDEFGKRHVAIFILLAIWMASTLFATTKGVRFILQVTPVVAIGFGAFLGIIWKYATNWANHELKINRIVAGGIIFLLLSIFLIQPISAGYDQAYNSVPAINDGWYNTLTKINTETAPDSIITSWWDFGYWFRAVANRSVTFDGGTQVEWDAHFVGKALLTSDEKQSTGIIRMLNCGQNNAFRTLDAIWNDTHREINVLDVIVTQDKVKAAQTLEAEGLSTSQIDDVLHYTHCDAPMDYFITSEDMVGKAPVWGHFGSWDFMKAEMYMSTRDMSSQDAVAFMEKEYNISSDLASQYYTEIKTKSADEWIAGWPSYLSGLTDCSKKGNMLDCPIATRQGTVSISIDLNSHQATVGSQDGKTVMPEVFVYATKDGIVEKKGTGNVMNFGLVLIPSGDDAGQQKYQVLISDPVLATSVFTKLFFFEGHGLSCFSNFDRVRQFTGGKIATWKVDYSCTNPPNKVFFSPVEKVDAAHILIAFSKHNETEALALATKIHSEVTAQNFAEYAQNYSEDPGSAVRGGELGEFGRGVMVKEFEKAAFSLNIGEISQPIKTQFGYHLILLNDKTIEDPEGATDSVVVEGNSSDAFTNESGKVSVNAS